jgi:hypothetical protein
VQALDAAAAADAGRSGETGSVAIERDDQRFVEAAGEVRVRGMGEVMLDALQLGPQPELVEARFELFMPLPMERLGVAAPLLGRTLGDVSGNHSVVGKQPVGERLRQRLLHPLVRIEQPWNDRRPARDAVLGLLNEAVGLGSRSIVEVGPFRVEVPLEQTRLFFPWQKGITDGIDVLGLESGRVERGLQRLPRKPVLQLDAREPLLSGRKIDAAVTYHRDGRILVER